LKKDPADANVHEAIAINPFGKVIEQIAEYCTISTVGSQGVTCDGREHYRTKFMGEN
jgi:hypothetical protein